MRQVLSRTTLQVSLAQSTKVFFADVHSPCELRQGPRVGQALFHVRPELPQPGVTRVGAGQASSPTIQGRHESCHDRRIRRSCRLPHQQAHRLRELQSSRLDQLHLTLGQRWRGLGIVEEHPRNFPGSRPGDLKGMMHADWSQEHLPRSPLSHLVAHQGAAPTAQANHDVTMHRTPPDKAIRRLQFTPPHPTKGCVSQNREIRLIDHMLRAAFPNEVGFA